MKIVWNIDVLIIGISTVHNTVNYIYAQEKAGHNKFINEKKAINFLFLKLDELIEK